MINGQCECGCTEGTHYKGVLGYEAIICKKCKTVHELIGIKKNEVRK